jgi:hypothetical protein
MEGGTLLTQFFKIKLDSYRSQQIPGFSDRKYAAALFMLAGHSMKHRAGHLNISYSVFRRWATEAAFKQIVEKLTGEFASSVIRHVREKATNCSYENFANLTWDGVFDANDYSKTLRKHLNALYLKEIKTFRDRRFIFAMCFILNLTGDISDKAFKQFTRDIGRTNKAVLKLLFMSARAVTQKYSLNVRDKSFVQQMLGMAERLIFQ